MRLYDWRQKRNAGVEALLDRIKRIRSSLQEADTLQKTLQRELENYDPYYRACICDKDTLQTQQRLILTKTEELQHQLESFVALVERTIAAPVDSQLRLSSSGPTQDGLRVAYLNVEGAKKKTAQIRYVLQRYDLDVLFIAEAKLTGNFNVQSEQNKTVFDHWCQSYPTGHVHMAGYSLEREDRKLAEEGQGGGGILAYIRNGLSYSVIERYTAVGNHPLQYIYLYIDSKNAHIVGAYNPPPYKEDEHLRLLHRFKNQENLIIMGDMNIDYFSSGYPMSQIEGSMGYKQLIENYTRVSLQDQNSHSPFFSKTLIDHIYVKDSKILESGVVRCGISDHDLIYCTLESSNPHTDQRSGKDVLQHDVPFIVSALIHDVGRHLDQYILVSDPQFWLLARRMETRRLTLCGHVETLDIKGMKSLSKTSKFAYELNNLIQSHNSCHCQCGDLVCAIDKARSYAGAKVDCCLKGELGHWAIEHYERNNTLSVFVRRLQIFFGFCFPLLAEACGVFLTVHNPHSAWSKRRPLDVFEYESFTLVLSYTIADDWHVVGGCRKFWDSDLISDHGEIKWNWKEFIQYCIANKKNDTQGVIEFDNLVGHQYLHYRIKGILSSCKGVMAFNSEPTGLIYLPISPSPVSRHEIPATAQTPFRSQLPPPLPCTKRTYTPSSRFGEIPVSRLGYRRQHIRTQPVSTRPVFNMPQKLKTNIEEIITAIRQPGQGVEFKLEWNVLGSEFKTQQALPTIKEVLEKYPEVVRNPLIG